MVEELPGLILVGVLIDRLGRKLTMANMLVVCALFLLPLVIHRQSETWTTVFLFGSRACIMGAFTTAFIFAPEVTTFHFLHSLAILLNYFLSF